MSLTDRDRQVLDLEGSWWTEHSTKSAAIRSRLGLSPAAYYRRLSSLVDREDARAHAPLAVMRLRRKRSKDRKDRLIGFAQEHHPRR